MKAFQFNTTPGIRFGSDYSVGTAEEVSKKLGKKILFVTDPGLVKIGLHEKTITVIVFSCNPIFTKPGSVTNSILLPSFLETSSAVPTE